ncbi:hypothetical protein [Micromonospora rhizosphaerae]|uniref:hypothetical protein n=1 Tax=Micromonospora rhizosphaerae TaxID=568872 RepID=UPI000B89B3DE|nr:hypothetical protein [Micromonospora rhizosphaerae]
MIVAEFFDVGYLRQLPWPRRPQAARLLAALADPGRGFDAVVVGEFERAFYGNQFRDLAPLFKLYGVELWLPELNGPVDASNDSTCRCWPCSVCTPDERSSARGFGLRRPCAPR